MNSFNREYFTGPTVIHSGYNYSTVRRVDVFWWKLIEQFFLGGGGGTQEEIAKKKVDLERGTNVE